MSRHVRLVMWWGGCHWAVEKRMKELGTTVARSLPADRSWWKAPGPRYMGCLRGGIRSNSQGTGKGTFYSILGGIMFHHFEVFKLTFSVNPPAFLYFHYSLDCHN
ncbi:hypothetical protein HPP92_010279 [Vanilla planifolia]|uniref:Uncharacterized protein n=1 Tax=Vanilla planifolia TaxID=51239 RepID=A0A835QYN8_VANPL|nr:hypothetical protein HPP92_010279 [Vanilla planifolia]